MNNNQTEKTPASKERSLLAKRIIAIAVAVALLAVGLILYFALAKPAEEALTRPEYLFDGEEYDELASILLMLPEHSRNDVESLTISNSKGTFTIKEHTEEGYSRFVLNGSTIVYMKTEDLLAVAEDTEHKLDDSDSSAKLVSDQVSGDVLFAKYGVDLEHGQKLSVDIDGKNYSFVLGSATNVQENGCIYYLTPVSDSDSPYSPVYSIIAVTSTTQFVLVGNEETELDEYALSGLLVASTVVPTIAPSSREYRISEHAKYEELSQYGLDDESSPASVEVVLTSGESYKFFVGDRTPSGGGYYARVDGRFNNGDYIVYVITYNTGASFFAAKTNLVDTAVIPYIGQDIERTSDFSLYRKDETGVRSLVFRAGLSDESSLTLDTTSYVLVYPAAYDLDEEAYYSKVLSSLVMVTASSVIGFGDEIHTPEFYEKYSLDLDPERLASDTDGNHAKIVFATKENPTEEDYYKIYFSPLQTDSTGSTYYYVYSPSFDMAFKLLSEGFEFVDWTLSKFIKGTLYFNYINCTDWFELISDRKKTALRYSITGAEKTYRAVVTEPGENGALLKRTDSDGNQVDAVFDLKYVIKSLGTYLTPDYYGDFENFRSLFYILITRMLSIEEDPRGKIVADEPAYYINIADTPCDQPISYYRYDESGNRVYYTDENGNQRTAQVRYCGGNIICSNVVNTLSDGTQLKYDVAYYDEAAGRFFTKVRSTNDGNLKPANYEYDKDNNLVVSRYLPQNTTGEYTQTVYSHKFYDIYNVYTDAIGKEVKQINQTYKYGVTTVTKLHYRIEADGTRTLLSETSETAEQGFLIRTQMIDKLFSASAQLLAGETIDREAIN